MISRILRFPSLLAFGPSINIHNYDKPAKGEEYYFPKNDSESGWDRIKIMFKRDDFGRMSSELNSVYQATFLGIFVGAVYGGFLGSRKAYMDFMERNQATAFKSHFEAKRRLQDQVTMGFAKNAFRFGWRLALFTTSYTGITTAIAVYRGHSSMYEYVLAGVFTGASYKFNMGLRGMAAGALVGGALGTVGGAVSLLILKATGMTMEEMRYWQYKWRANRDDTINEGFKTQVRASDPRFHLLDDHDSKHNVGKDNLDLKILDSKQENKSVTEKTESIVVNQTK